MKYKLLIIDDRPRNRTGNYKRVLGNTFELEVVDKASDLEETIESVEVEGYIVDIVLSKWFDSYNKPLKAIEVLRKIKSVFKNRGKEKPIFLVSNEYETLIKNEELTTLINQTIDEEININTFFTFGEFLNIAGSDNKDSLRPIPKTILWHIKKNLAKEEKEVDYAIITALYYNEMEEVLRAFSIGIESKKTFGEYFGFEFTYQSKRIIFMSQHQMGMVDSALLSSEIMLKYNPRFLFMPGVCAGSDKTEFGDVIVAKKIQLFQTGKLKQDSFELESTTADIDKHTIQAIQTVGKEIIKEIQTEFSDEIQNKMLENLEDEFEKQFEEDPNLKSKVLATFKQFKKRKNITPHSRPTACSTFVVDKDGYFDKIRETFDRKIIGLEMEGYGVARASEIINNRTKTVMIKSVMDKSNDKSDLYKGFAAYVSAQFIKKLIDKNILE